MMKYFLFMILMLMGFSPDNGSESTDDYDRLWAEVTALESKSLPKSAYETVEKIYSKALKEKNEGQLIKAIIYKSKLTAEFEDRDPADLILDFETELEAMDMPVVASVVHSMLGELYFDYGIRNAYRFDNRMAGSDTDKLPFASLEEIQNKSNSHYLASLDVPDSGELSIIDPILRRHDTDAWPVEALGIFEFLLFRALHHYSNSAAFVALPSGRYLLNDPALFGVDAQWHEALPDKLAKGHYALQALELYRKADVDSRVSDQNKRLLQIARLDYISAQYEGSEGQNLFIDALTNHIKNFGGFRDASVALAYEKLIQIYLDKGDALEIGSEEENYYMKAFKWIQAYNGAMLNSEYSDRVQYLRQRLLSKSHEMRIEHVVPAESDFLVYLKYRNIPKLHFRLYRLSEEEQEYYLTHSRNEDRLSVLGKSSLIKEWSQDLPDSDDYMQHGTEMHMAGQSYGFYVLLSSHRPDFKYDDNAVLNYSAFVVSDLSYITTQPSVTPSGVVLDRVEGQPVSNAEVQLYAYSYNPDTRRNSWNKEAEIRTDKDGKFAFDNTEINNYKYVIRKDNDILDLRIQHFKSQSYPDRELGQVNLYTDRAIYRPGQTIHFKGLVLSKSTKDNIPHLVKGQELVVYLRDVNNQIVAERKLVSNAFGTVQSFFNTPASGLTGNYQIVVSDSHFSGRHSVRVEEYKRPGIKARLSPLTESYVAGDTIRVKGLLESFSGLKLQDAEIKYEIVKSSFYNPYLAGYRIMPFHGRNEIIAFGSSTTREDGSFEISFPTHEIQGNEWSNYSISCDITDVTGESTTVQKTINLSRVPFRPELTMPASGMAGKLDSIRLELLNADGQAYNARTRVSVFSLETPVKHYKEKYWSGIDKQIIDDEIYNSRLLHESPALGSDRPVIGERLKSKAFNGAGLVSDMLNDLERGSYRLVFEIEDDRGFSDTIEKDIRISDRKKRSIPGDPFALGSLRTSIIPGEDMELFVNTPFKSYRCYVSVYHNNKEIASEILSGKHPSFNLRVDPSHRGGLTIQLHYIKHNRSYRKQFDIDVPWNNKELDIKVSNFRDRTLTNSKEKWTIEIDRHFGEDPVVTELMAVMYDKSLDVLYPHSWRTGFYPHYSRYNNIIASGFELARSYSMGRPGRYYRSVNQLFVPELNWYGLQLSHRYSGPVYRSMGGDPVMQSSYQAKSGRADRDSAVEEAESVMSDQQQGEGYLTDNASEKEQASQEVLLVRENFNETTFFYPELYSNNDGELKLEFTTNDALTNWRVMLLAHNAELEYGYKEFDIQTYRPVMVESFLPRFVRQSDSLAVRARISNLSDGTLEVNPELVIEKGTSGENLGKIVSDVVKPSAFQLEPGQSKVVQWQVGIPDDLTDLLDFTFIARTADFQDAEKKRIPVLSKKIFVTEGHPLYVNPGDKRNYDFGEWLSANVSESDYHKTILEYTEDASWLILKSLPYLLDSDTPSSTSLFDAIYAGLIGHKLVNDNPALGREIKKWADEDNTSPLESDSELKLVPLEETPWLRAGKQESDNIRKLAFLLDNNAFNYTLAGKSSKLASYQLSNGGFAWMPGGRDNWYMTQYVLEGLARLREMGIDYSEYLEANMVKRAISYIDQRFLEHHNKHFDRLSGINPFIVHYCFVRMHYPDELMDEAVANALASYLEVYSDKWPEASSYIQALLGMVYEIRGERDKADQILASLRQRMIMNEELGNYWNDQAGYYWYELNLEKQATLISFFEMKGAAAEVIAGMRLWLLKNKQVNGWPTSKATASAVYTFYNSKVPAAEAHSGDMEITIPGLNRVINVSASGGKVYEVFDDYDDAGKIQSVQLVNNTDKTGWGALHRQYFADIADVADYKGAPVKLHKEIYTVSQASTGMKLEPLDQNSVRTGDRLRVRIELVSDRPMEYIMLKDMRGSGTEPVNVLSGYRWQDGLGYYESTKDEGSYFYIDFLPKGNFVFEYDLFVTHEGRFESGIATLQSMYAPEFNSHSRSYGIEVNDRNGKEVK